METDVPANQVWMLSKENPHLKRMRVWDEQGARIRPTGFSIPYEDFRKMAQDFAVC